MVFALEHNHPVAGSDELLWLDPMLIPHLGLFRLEGLPDLAEASEDLAFLDAPDGPMKLDVGIEQVGPRVPIPALEELTRPPHDLHVLLGHRLLRAGR